MKVLLVYKSNPSDDDFESRQIPFGLYYVATVLLDNKYEVVVKNLSGLCWSEIDRYFREQNPDVVGISCYTFNRHDSFELAKRVKYISDKIITLLGGTHATLYYKQILKHYPQIDYVFVGEAEFSTLELLNALKGKSGIDEIKGVAYREGKNIHFIERPVIENLDSIPIPAKYFSYKGILASRGCPGRCIFCASPRIWNHHLRFRSVKNVVDELEMLNNKYGISQFFINDDTFTCWKEWVINLCKEILDRNLKIIWGCNSRVNAIDKEVLVWMKKAGCLSIYFGVESGSQAILDNIKKGITVAQIIAASRLVRELGMELKFYLIVGSPGETSQTINETIDLIKRTKPHQIEINIMQLVVGTELFMNAVSGGLINEDLWLESEHKPIFNIFEQSYEKLLEWQKKISDFYRTSQSDFNYSYDEIMSFVKTLGDAHSYYLLALHNFRIRKADEVVNQLNKVLELNKGYAPAYNVLGVIYASSGMYEKAIVMFNEAIKRNPVNIAVRLNLGNALIDSGRIDEAEQVYNQILEIDPLVFKAYQNLASIYHFKKENARAFKLIESGPQKLKPLLQKLKEDLERRIKL
ncbi:MAG: radical SAM protein [Candidatus Woesearchaeota archaeon]